MDAVTLDGEPFMRATLLCSSAYSDEIPALADIDLDETRTGASGTRIGASITRTCASNTRITASKMRMGARGKAGLFARSRQKMSAASAPRQLAVFSHPCLGNAFGCVMRHSYA